ncbi:hypothetical protein [Mesorhizobium sp. M0213]|uniref:hypothetical protein n=1 Tax=Mesorhizobium sp. M0213 TaxID=2956917 RepID=UPI00333CA15B
MICGIISANFIETGAVIELDQGSDVTAEHDLFFLSMPNGGYASLYPFGNDRNAILVSAETAPAAYRNFRLELVEGNRWLLEMLNEGS